MYHISKINYLIQILLIYLIFLSGCFITSKTKKDVIYEIKKDTVHIPVKKKITEFEQILINAGLINIKDIDTSIKVDLKYSTTDNFLGINMYGDFKECYLQAVVAIKLAKAQKELKDTFPDYSLIVYDAVRPRSIQKLMWDSIKVKEKDRPKYLSNPKYGSLHNFGAAVDVSIVDESGKELDMGTPFDSFEELAYPVLEKQMLKKGLLTNKQVGNRKLLRYVMYKAGFFNIQTEWWHFNSCYRKEAREKYAMIETHKLVSSEILLAEKIFTGINIVFKIQIKTSLKPLNTGAAIFKGLEVSRYYHDGLYKYTTGGFKDLESCYQLRDNIRKMGFKDAFVACFNNEQRIGIREAIELLQY